MVQLLRVPGIVNLEPLKLLEETAGTIEEGIRQAVIAAIEALDCMRMEEGRTLQEDMLKRVEEISDEAQQVRSMTDGSLGGSSGTASSAPG